MIKKLYSADPEDDERDTPLRQSGEISRNEKLERAINNRKMFSYSYTRFWLYKNFGSAWCCCCRYRAKRNDKLFLIGQKKLFSEIDILEIVKKLRVMLFTSDVVLKRRQ